MKTMIRRISRTNRHFAMLVLLLGLFCSCSNRVYNIRAGQKLPKWTEGCLDIHSINSGRGECTFYILPDGTTMLVDAGEFHNGGVRHPMVEQKPDTLTRPYKVYAEYIKDILSRSFNRNNVILNGEKNLSIDYALLTHYHMDHMGRLEKDYERAPEKYIKTGMMALYDEIPYKKLIDRSYPDYSFDPKLKALKHWSRFVKAKMEQDGMIAEKFELGSDSQFMLVNSPEKYPDFKVINYHVNGLVWNNGEVLDCWEGKAVRENGASTGFLLSYGKFDWFAGGDAGDNGKVERPAARAIGRSIEAMKGHHHMSWHTMTEEMMDVFRPQVVVNQSFYAHQPWPETMKTVLTTGLPEGQTRDVFLTNLHDSTYENEQETLAKVKAYRGHVVIRVLPGGGSFYVYMLDDTDLDFRVKGVYGPYICN